jgi:hypothetical protein
MCLLFLRVIFRIGFLARVFHIGRMLHRFGPTSGVRKQQVLPFAHCFHYLFLPIL